MSSPLMKRVGSFWETHLLPRVIDISCSDKATGKYRTRICDRVSGEILEVGFGSGTNLLHYGPAVEKVYAVEPADLAWKRASKPIAEFGRPVERIGLDGAAVDLPDASVDAVVSSYTMCTIPDLDAALAEMQRVLRPGGRLHFVEHGLSPDAAVAARQRRWQSWWGKVAGGCHLDREIPALIAGAGFTIEELDSFYEPGPQASRPFGWVSLGVARPA